jgi:hypothetical protein
MDKLGAHSPIVYLENSHSSIGQATLLSTILFAASFVNAAYVFTRTRTYRLSLARDPVTSPNAQFVPDDYDFEPIPSASIATRLFTGLWSLIISFARFLLRIQSSESLHGSASRREVQQLEVWAPREMELKLFTIYSPAHAFLWKSASSTNWHVSFMMMGVVSLQACSVF